MLVMEAQPCWHLQRDGSTAALHPCIDTLLHSPMPPGAVVFATCSRTQLLKSLSTSACRGASTTLAFVPLLYSAYLRLTFLKAAALVSAAARWTGQGRSAQDAGAGKVVRCGLGVPACTSKCMQAVRILLFVPRTGLRPSP